MKSFSNSSSHQRPRWWLDLAVSLVASLVAFSVSLFITEQQKLKNKKNTAWNVAQVTLSNIDELINNFDVVTTYYDDFRDQYEEIKGYGDLSKVPDTLCAVFIDYIEGWDIFAINRAPEMTFSTTFELWDYLENIPLIRRIGNCYAYSDAFIDFYNHDLQNINDLSNNSGMDNTTDYRKKLQIIMGYPPFQNYMRRSKATSSAYHNMVDRLREYNKQNKEDMKVSDEDLNNLVAPQHWASDEDDNAIFVVGPDM